jgi:CheY-like chemotaxis protein
LRHLGFDATSFTDPLAALKAARSQHPDLLITDVVMPQLSGIELALQVEASCPDCKVLLFSSTADLLEAARANGHDFELVLKPVHPKDLLSKIQGSQGRYLHCLPSRNSSPASKRDPTCPPKSLP